MQHEEALSNLADRVHLLEDGMKMGKTRQDAIGKEVKVILAEIHIITEWIHQRFGKIKVLIKQIIAFMHYFGFCFYCAKHRYAKTVLQYSGYWIQFVTMISKKTYCAHSFQ